MTVESRASSARRDLVAILFRRPVATVLVVVLTVMLGMGMVFPIVPLYARSFGVSIGIVGVFLAGYGVTRLGFDLIGGPVVDRFGERPVTVAGLAAMAGATLATAMATSFLGAALMWALSGAGSAVVFAALYSYLLKVVPKDEMARALGLFYGTFNVGIIAGAPLGGLVAHSFGLRGPLVAYAVALALAALLYFVLIRGSPEAPPVAQTPERARLAQTLASLFRSRGFLVACAGNLAYLWMIAGVFDTLVPLMAHEGLGMSTGSIGVLFAVATAAELAVLYPAGTWADARGRRAVLAPALAGLTLMIVAVGWATGPVVLGVLLGGLGIASGVAGVPPGAMLSDVSPQRAAGTAVGVFRFCGDLGFVLGPVLAGAAADAAGFRWAFAVTAVPVAAAWGVALWGPETLASSADR